jgi:hypothetical protein
LISAYLLSGRLSESVRPFTPARFVTVRAHGTERAGTEIAVGAQ